MLSRSAIYVSPEDVTGAIMLKNDNKWMTLMYSSKRSTNQSAAINLSLITSM